jgi:hypothetical protein
MKLGLTSFLLLATKVSSLAQGNLTVFTNWNIRPFIGNGYITPVPDTSAYGGSFLFQSGGGTISQTFSTVTGFYYALTFSAIEYQGSNNVIVNLNGSQTVLTFTTPVVPPNNYNIINTNAQDFSFNFMATSNRTTLSFNYFPEFAIVPDPPGQDLYYGYGAIAFTSVSAVPEPSPSLLVLLGSGALIYYRHKWKRRLPNRI